LFQQTETQTHQVKEHRTESKEQPQALAPQPSGWITRFRSMDEVLAHFPAKDYNLVLPLRAPRTTERYELWATIIEIEPTDCARIGETGTFMLLKHKLYELAREAGVIVRSIEQVLPSTWKNVVELAKELGKIPNVQQLSREWIYSELQPLLHHRRNDVAVRAVVLLETAPGEYVQAIGHAEWIEEDERDVIARAVRRKAQEENWSEERINAEIENRLIDARRFRLRLAETKALLRAIRAILSLKTSYTVEELKKPFVIVSWRRVLSDEELEERWREVFGDLTHEERPVVRVVEVTEADNGESSEITPDEIPSELDMM